LGNVFTPRLVKLNLKAGKYATFILETAATFKLKGIKPADVIMPQRSASTAQAFCQTHLTFLFHKIKK